MATLALRTLPRKRRSSRKMQRTVCRVKTQWTHNAPMPSSYACALDGSSRAQEQRRRARGRGGAGVVGNHGAFAVLSAATRKRKAFPFWTAFHAPLGGLLFPSLRRWSDQPACSLHPAPATNDRRRRLALRSLSFRSNLETVGVGRRGALSVERSTSTPRSRSSRLVTFETD